MLRQICLMSCVVGMLGFSVKPLFAEGGTVLKVGDTAPVFSAKDDAGKEWSSSDHVGKKIMVVYFYPADMTGGCTKQACGFRDDMKSLADKGVEVVGISGDSTKNHELFKKEHQLNFSLLADPNGKVAEAFGVPFKLEEKTVKGIVAGKEESFTRTATIQRWTFVIDKSGKIANVNSMVKAADDSKAIQEFVEKLK